MSGAGDRVGSLEVLNYHVPPLVHLKKMALHATRHDQHKPDEAPDAAREDRDQQMQDVVDGLTGGEHRLILALALDASPLGGDSRGDVLRKRGPPRASSVARVG